MSINEASRINKPVWGRSPIGIGAVVVFLAVSAVAAWAGRYTVLGIAWVAFLGMVAGAYLGGRTRTDRPRALVWGYGLAAGAMLTSAAVFLVPQAIGFAPRIGGFGIAAGVLMGYGGHVLGHRLTHLEVGLDVTAASIAAHALAAGLIIGLVYASMPDLGALLGLAIVSHKGPAGYAAAKRLSEAGLPVSALLLPAAGVGLTALPVSLLPIPSMPVVNAAIFGFGAGIFLHVAMDFMPSCEVGGEIAQIAGLSADSHAYLDSLRTHSVASTTLGGLAVFVAWLAVV
jgi:ZIP family zinc transporter